MVMTIMEIAQMLEGDIDHELQARAMDAGTVAWDIETSGLDWRIDRIGTCQLSIADKVIIVKVDDRIAPHRLIALLEDERVRKVFHHAPFDLRFMMHRWAAKPANVACTKVAARIVHPSEDPARFSLKPLLSRYLNVEISKDQQQSDWLRERLSSEQLRYAAADVAYLLPLLERLRRRGEARQVWNLVEVSFAYLPTRVSLDLMAVGDVFHY